MQSEVGGECVLETQFTVSKSFEAEQDKFYSIEGFLKRVMKNTDLGSKNGFLRLDFYSQGDKIIKTYVSKQLDNSMIWQKVNVSGVAPFGSRYAKIGFQLDQYYPGEEYWINSFKIYVYGSYNKIDLSQYPYYNKPLPENFYWLLEL